MISNVGNFFTITWNDNANISKRSRVYIIILQRFEKVAMCVYFVLELLKVGTYHIIYIYYTH